MENNILGYIYIKVLFEMILDELDVDARHQAGSRLVSHCQWERKLGLFIMKELYTFLVFTYW